jgi:hypothetical protein
MRPFGTVSHPARSDPGFISSRIVPMAEFVWTILLPLVLVVAIVDCATQSPTQRVKRLSRSGLSQRAIAAHTGLSRYKVRRLLAA